MSSSGTPRGMPLLSSPAPVSSGSNESHCRRCNKEFSMFFTRSKRCNHCGYSYCSNCCDHQALCRRSGRHSGYDALPVCAYCIEMLSITASGRTQLRSMPISKLRSYLESYDIHPDRVLEKDDLVNAILDARGDNGCLSPEQEAFYQRETVPNRARVEPRSRGLFSRSNQVGSGPAPSPRSPPRPVQQYEQTPRHNSNFSASAEPPPPPRPPQSPRPSHPQYRPPPGPPPQTHYQNQGRTAPPSQPRSPSPPPRSQPPRSPQPPRPAQNESLRPPQPPPRPQSVPPEMPRTPRPHPQPARRQTRPSHATPPPLSALLDTPKENVAKMSVFILKGILDANHVNARLVLEKSELVDKVWNLIEVEKRERERERRIHEMEEQEAVRRQQELLATFQRQQAEREAAAAASSNNKPNESEEKRRETSKQDDKAKPEPPKPMGTFSLDRDGLCVICQDEEANIAIVDCGHLALCMGCSQTVMKSTKECPLCRTRIVTEQRLLRIFKT